MKTPSVCTPLRNRRLCTFCLCTLICLCGAACSESTGPPYIKAYVIDVYNNKTELYNVHLLYWWQERGETPFLETYSHTGKMLMVRSVKPQDTGQTGGELIPLRIDLNEIDRIEWRIDETGKKMYVHTSAGTSLQTQCLFPQELRVDPASGLADYKLYITGMTRKNSPGFDFKQDLDFVKSIVITGIETQRQ